MKYFALSSLIFMFVPCFGNKNTGVELFNLRNDIAESKNLAESQPVMVEKLKKEM